MHVGMYNEESKSELGTTDALVEDAKEAVKRGFTAVRFAPYNEKFYLHKSFTEWANEWQQATQEILQLVLEDKIKYKETITKGFENAPQALRDVLTGKNFGKQIIEI